MEDRKEFLALVGQRIKAERILANLSQQQVASFCDFEKSHMSRLESGKTNPTIFTLRKVCLALKTNISSITHGL